MSGPDAGDGDPGILERLELTILGNEPRFTRHEVVEKAGVSLEFADRLWRALGFPTPRDEDAMFNVADVEALETMSALSALGAVEENDVASQARSLGQSYARLAEWQAALVSDVVLRSDEDVDGEQILRLTADLLPLMQKTQSYVWRRHLATAAVRALAQPNKTEEASAPSQVVGFADIVGFTRMSRRLDDQELVELIEHFEDTANAIIAGHQGRVIKNIGDEVMFVADSAVAGAELALDLASRGEGVAMSPLRIGMSYGQTLSRLGDVYGPVVNVAARLTSIARPGTVVVDRALADELAENGDFKVRKMRRVKVRGYNHLEPWVLRPTDDG